MFLKYLAKRNAFKTQDLKEKDVPSNNSLRIYVATGLRNFLEHNKKLKANPLFPQIDNSLQITKIYRDVMYVICNTLTTY